MAGIEDNFWNYLRYLLHIKQKTAQKSAVSWKFVGAMGRSWNLFSGSKL